MVDQGDPNLPIDDHGLIVGDGAFETLKTTGGRAFAVTRHLQRLTRSLEALAIAMPDKQVLRDAIEETVAAAGHSESRIRLTVTPLDAELLESVKNGRPMAAEELRELRDCLSRFVPAAQICDLLICQNHPLPLPGEAFRVEFKVCCDVNP